MMKTGAKKYKYSNSSWDSNCTKPLAVSADDVG